MHLIDEPLRVLASHEHVDRGAEPNDVGSLAVTNVLTGMRSADEEIPSSEMPGAGLEPARPRGDTRF